MLLGSGFAQLPWIKEPKGSSKKTHERSHAVKIKVLISALFAVMMVASGVALAQDSRAAVVINLAGEEICQVCQDSDGDGSCDLVVNAIADHGIVVDKTTGAPNAPQIITLTCQVSGLANNSGRGLYFDSFNTAGTECVVVDRDFNEYFTASWRQTLSPTGVAHLSCLLRF